jgi:hypothetical protein|tara:strand:- start:141 stop:323 length:183 start_codon:yes stop_codon:yes gene_type:complete
MTESEMRAQMESVSMFVDEILSDFNRVDMSVKKADMLAHIDYWRTTLQTIKYMMKTDGII